MSVMIMAANVLYLTVDICQGKPGMGDDDELH